jgi:hypothetical protein
VYSPKDQHVCDWGVCQHRVRAGHDHDVRYDGAIDGHQLLVDVTSDDKWVFIFVRLQLGGMGGWVGSLWVLVLRPAMKAEGDIRAVVSRGCPCAPRQAEPQNQTFLVLPQTLWAELLHQTPRRCR